MLALTSGTACAPSWVIILDASDIWKLPPWDIAGGSKMLWIQRFTALREARITMRNNANG